jgi:hypothetical protein
MILVMFAYSQMLIWLLLLGYSSSLLSQPDHAANSNPNPDPSIEPSHRQLRYVADSMDPSHPRPRDAVGQASYDGVDPSSHRQPYYVAKPTIDPSSHRQLRHHFEGWYERVEPAYFGRQGIVGNITVYGAVVNSDVDLLFVDHKTLSEAEYQSRIKSFLRLENIRNLSAELPFELVHWPSVVTRPCPQNRHGHKTERGVSLAHYQIWLDFIYFDQDVIDLLQKGLVKGIYNSTTWTSTGGMFAASENGTLYKNNIPFQDNDILVVFEDDAESVILDTNNTVIEELSAMNTDLLYLGWCEGRLARPVPLCTQAYAVTRRGARKLVKYFEPCGPGIDEQMVRICKNNWLSYRRVNDYSYKKNLKPNYPRPGDKTYGIFHQNKHDFVSINNHRYR